MSPRGTIQIARIQTTQIRESVCEQQRARVRDRERALEREREGVREGAGERCGPLPLPPPNSLVSVGPAQRGGSLQLGFLCAARSSSRWPVPVFSVCLRASPKFTGAALRFLCSARGSRCHGNAGRLGRCNYVELIDTIFTDVEGVD